MHKLLQSTVLSLLVMASCSADVDEPDEEDEVVHSDGGSGSVQYPPRADDPENNDVDDENYDPCPNVTYVLWGGQEVTLDVFCDPQPVFNLGCPGPDSKN